MRTGQFAWSVQSETYKLINPFICSGKYFLPIFIRFRDIKLIILRNQQWLLLFYMSTYLRFVSPWVLIFNILPVFVYDKIKF